MKDWERGLIPPTVTIREAIAAIDRSKMQIGLVVDAERKLLGTVTDGDVRRAVLRGLSLDDRVLAIMNAKPRSAPQGHSKQKLLALMKRTALRAVPLLDEQARIVDVALLSDLLSTSERDNLVVIMAGGLGRRLRPLTDDCPKPLIKVGAKPILETILEGFKAQGFGDFCLCVNYRADMIREYFGDGEQHGVRIKYVEEPESLGTAGALSLLPEIPAQPFVVMNCDLLTNLNFSQLLDFHADHHAVATMCVREYDLQVPYGVVKLDGHRIVGIEEKPVHRYFVNAGIYVLDPKITQLIRVGEYLDMTTLFERVIASSMDTAVFPIREYWLDVGRIEDLEQARLDYGPLFQ